MELLTSVSPSTSDHRVHSAPECSRLPPLPVDRGPLSAYVLARLAGRTVAVPGPVTSIDALVDDDLQLALYLCYELHYGALADGGDALEWDPSLLELRAHLESSFESALRARVPVAPHVAVGDLVAALTSRVGGPSVSEFVRDEATVAQLREYLVHRSAYQLKEADPHTWVVPRLRGVPKQRLVRIQAGEYGVDHGGRIHAELFADTMDELGLDQRPNAHLDVLPAVSLAISNLASMLGLHRRWRGAAMGHLALSELTSVEAMERYVAGLDRLHLSSRAQRFFRVHVLADAEHSSLMIELLEALVGAEVELHDDVAFGVGAALAVESAFATRVVAAWRRGASSLRDD